MGRDLVLHRIRTAVHVGGVHRRHQHKDNLFELPCIDSVPLFFSLFLRDLGCHRRLVLRHHPITRNSPEEDREARWATPPGVRSHVGRGLGDSLCGILVLGQLAG